MKIRYSLTTLIVLLLLKSSSFAQMIGDNVFLQGHFVEIGIAPNGGYGSTRGVPAGYHANNTGDYFYDPALGVAASADTNLGFIADYGRDGWDVGSPAFYGDYFLPGTPQEGWSVQVNGYVNRCDAFIPNYYTSPTTGYTGTGTLTTGTNTGYSNTGGILKGIWQGQNGNLKMRQTTQLDTNELFFTINVVFVNTGTDTLDSIYYMRTLDPDNEVEEGGGFSTDNLINYNDTTAPYKQLVSATGLSYSAFLGLGTKDCRATPFIISFSLDPYATDPDMGDYWNQTAGSTLFGVGTEDVNDEGIGLVYNLGNLAPGDSTELTYTYVLSADALDSALDATSPTVNINGITFDSSFLLEPCTSDVDTIPITISGGGFYHWHWAPTTGLSDSVGVTNHLIVDSANGTITYTITGVNTAGACSDKTFYLTINPSPQPGPPTITDPAPYCQGQPFQPFIVSGTGILWYPNATGLPSTASPTYPVINTDVPGTYTVYATQTVGGCVSTVDSFTVLVNPTPSPNFTYTVSPQCQGDTVRFTNTTPVADSYTWDFGDGSSSTDTNPTHIYSSTGTYNVKLTALEGSCPHDTTIIITLTHPAINAAFTPTPDTMCVGVPTILTNTSVAATDPTSPTGGSFAWTYGDSAALNTPLAVSPSYTYSAAGIYTAALTVTDSIGCQSTVSHNVYVLTIGITSFDDTTFCTIAPFPLDNAVNVFPEGVADSFSYSWTPATGLDDPTLQHPMFGITGDYTYTFTATIQPYGCIATHTQTIHAYLPAPITDLTPSQMIPYGSSIQLNADGAILYTWVPDDGTLDNPNINNPIATPTDSTTYIVYGLDVFGCRDTGTVTITIDYSTTQFMPTGFTPNDDGRNDFFGPVGIKYQKVVDFRVFNRWGQQIFYSTTADAKWDGTYQGVPQDMGTYNYMIILAFPDGSQKTYTGTVTLIR